MLTYESSSSITNLKIKIFDILIELKSQNFIIEQIVTLTVLNVLKSSFFIYFIVLMKSARKEDNFSNLSSLFQNLVDEKNRQRVESMINVTKKKAENKPKRENKKNELHDENDKKNKCFRYDQSSHSKEKCSIVNFECI